MNRYAAWIGCFLAVQALQVQAQNQPGAPNNNNNSGRGRSIRQADQNQNQNQNRRQNQNQNGGNQNSQDQNQNNNSGDNTVDNGQSPADNGSGQPAKPRRNRDRRDQVGRPEQASTNNQGQANEPAGAQNQAPQQNPNNGRDNSSPQESPSDRALSQQIRSSITANGTGARGGGQIQVFSKGGVVTLRGSVASEAERQSLEQRIKTMQGVRSVVNQLRVSAGAEGSVRQKDGSVRQSDRNPTRPTPPPGAADPGASPQN